MDHLLNSRLSREQSPSKLDNLSPEKYGKGAYANLTYTPSKLADNILFKEVTTLKKIQEESSKVRQSQAYNGLLRDRLGQLLEEKDGIEQTLTQQIFMYKKILSQTEIKHQQRLKDIQKSFNEEVQKLILAKEQQAKYSQSEKELLEGKIYQLEAEVAELKSHVQNHSSNFDELTKDHEKLEIHYKNVCDKLDETEKRSKEELGKAKNDYEELSRKLFNTEVEFKSQIEKLQLERQKQKENIDRLHRNQLQKVENKRLHEAMVKNQQLKDLTGTFQSETNRLNSIILNKQRNIQDLNGLINEEKQRFTELTKSSTQQITNLIHEKNRYKQEVNTLNLQLAATKEDLKALQVQSDKEIASRDAYIAKLKDELELSQVNHIREKDKCNYVIGDLDRQNLGLKSENQRLSVIDSQNAILCREVRNLKDLLLESSLQMQKCKDEFIRIGREKDLLSIKVRQLGYENETLHRMKIEKQQQVRGWRESYYMSRR